MPAERPDAARRAVGSVARATQLLDVLAASETPLGVNELARRIGVNASTASRLLATLQDAGLVMRTDGGPYRLGLKLVTLSDRVLAGLDVRALARPLLARLVVETGETATLSLPGETEAITVDFVPVALQRGEHGPGGTAQRVARHRRRQGDAGLRRRGRRRGTARARIADRIHRAHDHRPGGAGRGARYRPRPRVGRGRQRARGRSRRAGGAGVRSYGRARGDPRRPGPGVATPARRSADAARAPAGGGGGAQPRPGRHSAGG